MRNISLEPNCGGSSQPHQSAGDADHSHGGLGGLGHIKQVVEQRLVLMVGEQVELVQDKENRTAAAAIAWPETPKLNQNAEQMSTTAEPKSSEKCC